MEIEMESLADSFRELPIVQPRILEFGRFQFLRVLGKGAFGVVYLVRDSEGKFWALKSLSKAHLMEKK